MIRFFNFASSNQLNQILSQPNPSLEEVLDEECVINEVRNSNHKLINFLCRKETFDSLISYIIEIPNNMPYDPTESRKDEKLNKYPYLACEILAVENDTLAQYFLGTLSDAKIQDIDTDTIPDDNELERTDSMNIEHPKEMSFRKEKHDSINEDTQMEIEFLPPIIKFVRYINADPSINLTIAGYYAKVLRNLFFFKPAQMAAILYDTHFKYIQRMAAHIYSDSIQEIFSVILKLDNTYFKSEAKDTFIEKRIQLVQRTILNLFEKPNEVMTDDIFADLQVNSANLLVHLLLNIEGITNGHEIIAPLLEPQVLNKITTALAEPSLISPITPLLVELCEYESHIFAPKKGMSLLDLNHYTEPVSQSEIPEDNPFLLAIIDSVEVIAFALEADNDKINPQEIPMQHGFSTYCFGKVRLNLLELVNSYIKLQNEKMSMKMISCNLIPILLYLFVRNPWNNILHASLLKIFNFILVHGPETIIKALFEQGHILDFILEALKQSDFAINSKAKGKVTKGYTCYLHLLSNTIEECKFEYVQTFCHNHQGWQAYKEGELKEVNDKNNLKLGGEEAVSSTRSFSGFPRTTIYGGDNLEGQIPADEIALNEANYEEQEEETKADTDINNVLGYEAYGGYEHGDLRGEIGVSPTHNGEFGDSDIMERHDSEVKYPHSVYVKSGFKSESEGQNLGTLNTEPMESEQNESGHENRQETSQS